VSDALEPTDHIRNVLLLGHTGTGKSTLAEAMLAVAGGSPPRGPDVAGCTTVDTDPEERDRGHSLGLSLVSFRYGGYRFNVLDAPGGAEAVGDAYPALIAADTAVFVVDAAVGVQPQHEELWRACEARGIPRLVFLNKLDLDRAGYQSNIDDLRGRYGKRLAPVHMPLGIGQAGAGDGFDGIIDLLHFNAVEFHHGTRREEPVPEPRVEQAGRNREHLVEAVVENDDDLLERYFDGDVPDSEELAELFAHGVAEAGFFPVLCGSAERRIGVELLLTFVIEECPSPADSPHLPATDGDPAVQVVKTLSDQYLGRINLLRVWRGPLRADDRLTVQRTGETQRLHQLFRLCGSEQLPVNAVAAGDLVAVAKLDDVTTGDQLTAGGRLAIDVPEAPEGYHRVVLDPVSTGDDDKLSPAIGRMVDEDPSIRLHRHADTGDQIVSFLGPTHADVTVARLARKFGVHVTARPAPIGFRETIRAKARGVGRHVKQSGGHGQFGIAHIELVPLSRGAGFHFVDQIVGGVIPASYIPSVEKGIVTAMGTGPLGGYPVVDLEVRLVDGKHHPVDSSDAAFRMAGILAFGEAMATAQPVLLEPVMEVDVAVPDELTGVAMSDLSSRRGRIMGTDAAGAGTTMVHAFVPEAELVTFAAEFRAMTSGRGQIAMRHHHHEEVPDQVSRRLLDHAAVIE
jgi:elongation factor G